ncbi:MAG: tyrosine-type recombinase/integrase [Lachnospiraceae bacterium]|nr:tyrosine-type recombinase/integrase [Lachnospiraceae bacterium]
MTEYGKSTDSGGSDRGILPDDNDRSASNGRVLTTKNIEDYLEWLREQERETNTIDKYRRDLKHLYRWADGRQLTKLLVKEWKTGLQPGYQASSINSMLAAVNGFFHWMGWYDLEMKYLKIQKKIFCDKNKELTRAEYDKLVAMALALGKIRLAFLLETLCGMGLRVSELQFITVEAVKKGRADIAMKGKIRTIIFQKSLSTKLLQYAKDNQIESGEIFITRSGRSMSRSQIWREMKWLCEKAGVEKEKVFPHNLRHLFARSHYQVHRDLKGLSDLLGHSSVETTSIYLTSSGEECALQMEMLGLVS